VAESALGALSVPKTARGGIVQPLLIRHDMRVLLAVIEDLYTFAVYMLFGWYADRTPTEPLYLPTPRDQQLLSDTVLRPLREQQHEEPPIQFADAGVVVTNGLPKKNTIVYCAHERVPVRTTPDAAHDTEITTLSYGDMLMVLDAGEEWSYVAFKNKQGYVPTSALAHTAAEVYPDFEIDAENGPRSTNTVRLRYVIRDEFSASLNQLPLQAHEYVYYKLLRRGVEISWPDIRPRTPGSWTRILSLLDGITVGHMPTVGAIMEYTLPSGKAHLAYVEKVFPDLSIQISEADWPDRGIYNERVLVEEEWRALGATFIECA
jgi:hypothetical protein